MKGCKGVGRVENSGRQPVSPPDSPRCQKNILLAQSFFIEGNYSPVFETHMTPKYVITFN